jgi:ribosomal-protein-serine acetyltransferase
VTPATNFPLDPGDGLVLRKLSTADAEEVFSVVRSNRERLAPWMPWVGRTRTVEDQRAWIESVAADPAELDGLGIFLDGAYVGGCGIHGRDPWGVGAEIGYWLDGSHEGAGLVGRAVAALLGFCFDQLGVHRVTILAGVDNVRSRAVAERLGFAQEGVLRHGERGSEPHGFYDVAVYGLLEDEWRSRR